MGAGVVQVFTLEEHTGIKTGFLLEPLRETRRFSQWGRTSNILLVQPRQFLMEFRIGLGFRIHAFKLVERRDQRFRNIASAKLSEIWSFMACQRGLIGCLHSCSCLY